MNNLQFHMLLWFSDTVPCVVYVGLRLHPCRFVYAAFFSFHDLLHVLDVRLSPIVSQWMHHCRCDRDWCRLIVYRGSLCVGLPLRPWH